VLQKALKEENGEAMCLREGIKIHRISSKKFFSRKVLDLNVEEREKR
jgi:hypothetical protein